MPETKYLSLQEVAMLLGVTETSIKRYIYKGQLKAVKLGTRKNALVRITQQALDEFLHDALEVIESHHDKEGESEGDIKEETLVCA